MILPFITLFSALFAVGAALSPRIANSTKKFGRTRALSRFSIPKDLTTKEFVIAISVAGTLLLPASMLIASPLPLLFAPFIFIKTAQSIDRAKGERLRKVAAAEWPNVLSELHLRITAMGAPIHHGLFSAAKSTKSMLQEAFEHAERTFAITNSVELSLDELYKRLPFSTTFRVTEALKVSLEVPGGDTAGIILDLKEDLEREWRQQSEFEARLKGVKFARNFVVIVPIAMLLAGASIGGFSSYRSFASIVTLSLSALVVIICFVIVSRMTSPSSLYRSDVDLIGSAFRRRVER